MGVSIPGVTGLLHQPTGQVIDGSLRFSERSADNHGTTLINRDFGKSGSHTAFTFSCWYKIGKRTTRDHHYLFSTEYEVDGNTRGFAFYWNKSNGKLVAYDYGASPNWTPTSSTRGCRDIGWYHFVLAIDTTAGDGDRVKLYINGERDTGMGEMSQNAILTISKRDFEHYVGSHRYQANQIRYADGYMSQVYYVDDQQLDASYFGFTDPLTNTWRPKKYTGNFSYALTAPTYNSGQGSDVTTTEFAKMVDGDLSTYGQGNGASGTNRFIGFSLSETEYSTINVKIKNTTGSALDFIVQPSVTGQGLISGGNFASNNNNNGTVNVPANTTLEDTYSFPVGYEGFGRIYLNNNGNDADAWEIYDFGGTKVTTNSFYLPMDGNSLIGQDKSGNGTDFTPVNFGGSNSVDKATGALPILEGAGGAVGNVGVRTDAYADNLVIALPLVGDANDVSNRINGGSTTKVMTAVGNAHASSDTSHFYGGSFEFDGSGDYLSTPDNSDFAFGTGDFTVEVWYNPNDIADYRTIIDNRDGGVNSDNGWILGQRANGKIYVYSNSVFLLESTSLPSIGEWTHLAFVRSSGTSTLYVNGIAEATSTTSKDYTDDRWRIGGESYTGQGGSFEFNGYISDARAYKGVAKYTSNFIPASTNPDILPDTPSGVSGGSKITKITDGTVNFDGSGDYLDAGAVDTAFGSSSDWTLELFVNVRVLGLSAITDPRTSDSSNHPLIWMGGSPGNKTTGVLYYYAGGADRIVGTTVLATNKWHHVAVVRSSGTTTLYLDGKSEGSFSDSLDYASTTNFRIGQRYTSTAFNYNGFISNLRLVKGTAVYTSAFTPPERTLTNVTNTKLLCCQSNTSATASLVAPSKPEPFSGAGGVQGYGTTSDFLRVSAHSDFSLDGDFTVEWWHYRAVTSSNNGFMWTIGDSYTSTGLELYWGTSGTQLNLYTNNGSNITSATAATGWHHYAVVRNGTGSNNITVYYDGTSVHTISNTTTFSGNVTIGGEYYGGNITGGMHGPMSQFRLVKGTAVYTSDFTAPTTALTAITNTKLLTLQGSTPFSDNSGTNKVIQVFGNVNTDDISGRGNVSATTFNPFNTDINTVRGQETGYATWNPLKMGTSDVSMSEGNLFWRTTSNGPDRCTYSTIGMDSGKFYWENEIVEATATAVGIANGLANDDGGPALAHNWMYYSATGQLYLDGSASSYGDAYNTNGTIIGVAFDRDNLTLEFYKNGVSQGKLTSISGLTDSETYFAMCGDSGGASQSQVRVNFGQKPFKFPPPDGFQPLNAANVRPETVITRPDQYVGITTWKGDDQASHVINDLNFDGVPDFVWIKRRDGNASSHQLYDTIRGATKPLVSSSTATEDTQTSGLIDFVRNGFELGASSVVNGLDGDNGNVPFNYVAWCWKAGGSKGTFNIDDVVYPSAAAAGLDGGSLDPSGASIGTKQGFSILKYSGASGAKSISHGLSQAPTFIIVKCTAGVSSQNWTIYHKDLPTGDYMKFTSDEKIDYPMFNDSTPNSSTIPLGNDDQVSGSSGTYILYAWHDVPGLQKFGSYAGSSGKTFVELGFRPALLVIKFYDGTDVGSHAGWKVIDNQRNKFNISGIMQKLAWDVNEAENGGSTISTSEGKVDFLSNGFRIIDNHAPFNSSGRNYIYMAWAEAPVSNLYGGQSNAR